MTALYRGRTPRGGTRIATFDGWYLYRRRGKSMTWLPLKLIAADRARKANFWFAWNGERLSRTHDEQRLREHRPDLYRQVTELLWLLY